MAANRDIAKKEFVYYNRTQAAALQRSHSFCEYEGQAYSFVEQLGEGGFGQVFLAVCDKDQNKKLVVKKEKPLECSLNIKNQIKRIHIYNEGETMENNARFARYLLGLGEFYGDVKDFYSPHYMLTPYVPGSTLCQFKYTSFTQLFKVMQVITYGVMQFHENNIVHGDIKPQNIIIHVDGNNHYNAIFIDFDFSRIVNDLTYNSRAIYHAPELRESIPAQFNQDIYSLGYTLHYLYRTRCKSSLFASQSFFLAKEFPILFNIMKDPIPASRPTAAKVYYDLHYIEMVDYFLTAQNDLGKKDFSLHQDMLVLLRRSVLLSIQKERAKPLVTIMQLLAEENRLAFLKCFGFHLIHLFFSKNEHLLPLLDALPLLDRDCLMREMCKAAKGTSPLTSPVYRSNQVTNYSPTIFQANNQKLKTKTNGLSADEKHTDEHLLLSQRMNALAL